VEHLTNCLVVRRGIGERRQQSPPAEPSVTIPVSLFERAELRRDLGELEFQRIGVLETEFEDRLDVVRVGVFEDRRDVPARDPPGNVEFHPVGIDIEPDRRPGLLAEQRRTEPAERRVDLVTETGVDYHCAIAELDDDPVVRRHWNPVLNLAR